MRGSGGLSSYDPSAYSRRGGARGPSPSRKSGAQDSYDFDVSEDFADSPVAQPTRRTRETSYESMSSSRFGGTVRRASIDDRAKEILERNKSLAKPAEEVDYKTLQSEFAELLQGVNLPESKPEDEMENTRSTTISSDSPNLRALPKFRKQHSLGSLNSFGSPDGESLDISAADLEVGAFAARKMKEKAAERRRRMSFDYSPTPKDNIMGSASPDIHKSRRASVSNVGGFLMSTALSSIHQSKASSGDAERKGYGSLEKSDDDIYKMLNITAQGASMENPRFSEDPLPARSQGLLSKPGLSISSDQDDDHYHEDDFQETRDNDETGDYTEDFADYADDFEDHSPSKPTERGLPAPIATKPTASAHSSITPTTATAAALAPAPAPAPAVVSAPASVDATRLNTVEQIMQRWYSADPSAMLATSATPDLTQAGKPAYAALEESKQSPVFANLDSVEETTAAESELSRSNPSPPSAPADPVSRRNEALLAAVGTAELVTSIPPPAPIASVLSLPNWTSEDFTSSPAGRNRDESSDDDDAKDQTYERYDDEDDVDSEGDRTETQERESLGGYDTAGRAPRDLGDDDDDDKDVSRARRPLAESVDPVPLQEVLRQSRGPVTFSATLERVVDNPESAREAAGPDPRSRLSRSSRYNSDGPEDRDEDEGEDEIDLKEMRRALRPSAAPRLQSTSTAPALRRSIASSKAPSLADTDALDLITAVPAEAGPRRSFTRETVSSKGRLAASTTQKLNQRKEETRHRQPSLVRRSGAPGDLAGRLAALERELRAVSAVSRSVRSSASATHSPTRTRRSQPQPAGENMFVRALLDAVENVRSSTPGGPADLLSSQAEDELRVVVRDLMTDVYTLQQKEREVGAREKAVAIKEAVVSARDRAGGSNTLQSHSWRDLQRTLEALQEENELLRRDKELIARECEEQARALDKAKSRIAMLQTQATEREAGRGDVSPSAGDVRALEQQKAFVHLRDRLKAAGASEEIAVACEALGSLLKDYGVQERLLGGFQRENERLARELKDREADEAARIAKMLDQQDMLNKQLNCLKNHCNVGTGDTADQSHRAQHEDEVYTVRKSLARTADHLRVELELDAKVRHLQALLDEEREAAGRRERGLQNTLAGLRDDLAEAQAEARRLRDFDAESAQKELEALHVERRALLEKVQWMATNQKLVDSADDAMRRLRAQIANLKQELVRRGVGVRQLERLLDAAASDGGALDAEDADVTHDSAKSAVTVRGRSFADVKRIKELEARVRDLQEALTKRYPDSLTGLIHAARADKEVDKEVRALQQRVAYLEEELRGAEERYERKVRALRQEYERTKAALQAQQPPSPSPAPPRVRRADNDFSPDADLAQRARDAELELERVRAFYAKKVEDLARRHEQQLRALKRGDDAPPPPPPGPPPDHQGADELRLCRQRVELLERELMATAQELGALRAKQLQPVVSAAPPAPPAPTMDEVDALIEMRVQQAVRSLPPPVPAAPVQVPTPVLAPTPVTVPTSSAAVSADLEKVAALWLAEKERYILELRGERARAEELAREVSALRAHVEALGRERAQVQPPTLLHFQLLEQQLREVEISLQRRERELLAAVEEAKTSARVEHQRLAAAHAQELREKDVQLERFGRDLQALLSELKRCRPPPPSVVQ